MNGDMTDALGQMQALLRKMEGDLRERQVRDAVEGGAVIAVRPFSFEQPGLKDGADPWFGLRYADWRQMRADGFRGWRQAGKPGGKGKKVTRRKVIILYDEAAQWVREKMAGG